MRGKDKISRNITGWNTRDEKNLTTLNPQCHRPWMITTLLGTCLVPRH